MAGVTFSHTNPTVGTLNLRLPPTNVEWGFGINTNTTDTYGGQVVQLLSIRFDQLTIQGIFGKEGPHGSVINGNNELVSRPSTQFADYSATGQYAIGLSQLTQYFRNYFAVASAGDAGSSTTRGNYNQHPMTLTYSGVLNVNVDANQGEQQWLIYPTSMPSYRRANDNFAPQWQITAEIYQAPSNIYQNVQSDVLDRLNGLREDVGYTPSNIFSSPDGIRIPFQQDSQSITQAELDEAKSGALAQFSQTLNAWKNALPAYTEDDLLALLMGGASGPTGI